MRSFSKINTITLAAFCAVATIFVSLLAIGQEADKGNGEKGIKAAEQEIKKPASFYGLSSLKLAASVCELIGSSVKFSDILGAKITCIPHNKVSWTDTEAWGYSAQKTIGAVSDGKGARIAPVFWSNSTTGVGVTGYKKFGVRDQVIYAMSGFFKPDLAAVTDVKKFIPLSAKEAATLAEKSEYGKISFALEMTDSGKVHFITFDSSDKKFASKLLHELAAVASSRKWNTGVMVPKKFLETPIGKNLVRMAVVNTGAKPENVISYGVSKAWIRESKTGE